MIPSLPSIADVRGYTTNIVEAWHAANDASKQLGRNWYTVAHQLAATLDDDVRVGAAVMAALSANKSWSQNVRLAVDAASGNVHGHVGDALDKVHRLLAGEEPETVLPMGSKTGHFYRCIANPADDYAVVIDRHAHDIAVHEVYGGRDRGLSSIGRYEVLASAYRYAAYSLSELPSTVQAVTWCAHIEKGR